MNLCHRLLDNFGLPQQNPCLQISSTLQFYSNSFFSFLFLNFSFSVSDRVSVFWRAVYRQPSFFWKKFTWIFEFLVIQSFTFISRFLRPQGVCTCISSSLTYISILFEFQCFLEFRSRLYSSMIIQYYWWLIQCIICTTNCEQVLGFSFWEILQ